MYAFIDTKFLTYKVGREVQRTETAPKGDAICYISMVSFNEQNGAKHIL